MYCKVSGKLNLQGKSGSDSDLVFLTSNIISVILFNLAWQIQQTLSCLLCFGLLWSSLVFVCVCVCVLYIKKWVWLVFLFFFFNKLKGIGCSRLPGMMCVFAYWVETESNYKSCPLVIRSPKMHVNARYEQGLWLTCCLHTANPESRKLLLF